MTSPAPLADPSDVADIWRLLTDAEIPRVTNLIDKASQKLRQKCPFDVDERIALFATAPQDPTALDPVIVADVVATIVKRFLVNVDGFASLSEGVGPYSRSGTFVNRYDKTGSDVRGAIQITDSDIEQLRPAVPAPVASSFRIKTPDPQVLISRGFGRRGFGGAVAPDVWPGTGVE